MATMSSPLSITGNLTGSAKLDEVTRLLNKLQEDLEQPCLQPDQRDAALEQLKVYGRDPMNADPIFTKKGIETLTRHAFDGTSLNTSRNALRCIANAMLLQPATRQIFVNLGYESKACLRLKNDNRDDEFLVSRILFLTTYNSNINIESLIDVHHLDENINLNLSRHARIYDDEVGKTKLDPMEDMALIETLKLLFNLTHFCPQRSGSFTPGLKYILTILRKREVVPQKPMDPPIGQLVNSLMNIPFEKQSGALEMLFPAMDNKINVERLIDLLYISLKSYKEGEVELQLSPLFTLLRRLYGVAPHDVKAFMRRRLLPDDSDRSQPLGQSQSLSSRLLRLSTSVIAPTAREELSQLLFEMSDKDAKTFVQNVGYGFASGFLFQHNIPTPESVLDSSSASRNGNADPPSSSGKKPVNPITGQTLESERKYDGPEMTKEEKEREAERLFVLFERLKANGVITAEHPMAKMQQEGRFEELGSDDESE